LNKSSLAGASPSRDSNKQSGFKTTLKNYVPFSRIFIGQSAIPGKVVYTKIIYHTGHSLEPVIYTVLSLFHINFCFFDKLRYFNFLKIYFWGYVCLIL